MSIDLQFDLRLMGNFHLGSHNQSPQQRPLQKSSPSKKDELWAVFFRKNVSIYSCFGIRCYCYRWPLKHFANLRCLRWYSQSSGPFFRVWLFFWRWIFQGKIWSVWSIIGCSSKGIGLQKKTCFLVLRLQFAIIMSPWIWSNYSDLTRPHPKR